MTDPPMLGNILAQPQSHHDVLRLDAQNEATTKACAEILRKASGRILFTGMGASLFALYPAAIHLQQNGYFVDVVESSELLHFGFQSLRRGDVGLLVSRSGGSIEVLLLAEKMRAAGMQLIAVTNVPCSELEKMADLTLHVGSRADQLIAVQTYTGTVLKLLLLAHEVVAHQASSLREACEAVLPELATTISECLEQSPGWSNFFDSIHPLYLLGRGPALASIHEGALLLHETAKTAAVAISSGQFRHGPVETVAKDFRAVIFGAPDATRRLDRSLFEDLLRMGATVRWIGDEPPDHCDPSQPLMRWFVCDPILAPMFDIIPMQVAAYRLAIWRGIVPGDFRHASEITTSESGFPASKR